MVWRAGPRRDIECTTNTSSKLCQAGRCDYMHAVSRLLSRPGSSAVRGAARAAHYVRFGTSCYGYGLLAHGHVDVVVDAGLNPYDYMAQVSIVESAGAIMTDWEGWKLNLNLNASRVIATGDPDFYEQALRALSCC